MAVGKSRRCDTDPFFGGDQADVSSGSSAEPPGSEAVETQIVEITDPPAPTSSLSSTSLTTATTLPPDSEASGGSIFVVHVTDVTGSVCQGEVGAKYEREVTIGGPEDAVVVIGLDDLDDPEDAAWTGTFAGGKLVFEGTRAEDDGLTTATFEMTLSDDGLTLEGYEALDLGLDESRRNRHMHRRKKHGGRDSGSLIARSGGLEPPTF
jgi:hypothetical protein